LGVYPRYINGNPVTGTEGSIPPATSFDEDQIEIVTVIQNAGLTPDHNDLTQLWQAIQSLIAQKYITSPIVKKVHGAGADFVDLNAALQWVGSYIITPTGSVTFMVASGRWTYINSVEINHANANRITVQGGALLGASPTADNISCSGYSTASDGTNQIIYLRSIYATELSFTGGVTGFSIRRGGMTLRYLLITGSQTTSSSITGRGIDAYADLFLDAVSIWGMGDCGITITGCSVQTSSSLSIAICYCGMGYANGPMYGGINMYGGMFLAQGGSEVIIASCQGVGLSLNGGWAWFEKLTVKGTGGFIGPPAGTGFGIVTYAGGSIAGQAIYVMYNQSTGVWIAGGGFILGENSYYQYNGGQGVYNLGGVAWVNNSAITGNGSFDLAVADGGYIDASGAGVGTTNLTPNTNYGFGYIQI
jgi:hypothetical protein